MLRSRNVDVSTLMQLHVDNHGGTKKRPYLCNGKRGKEEGGRRDITEVKLEVKLEVKMEVKRYAQDECEANEQHQHDYRLF